MSFGRILSTRKIILTFKCFRDYNEFLDDLEEDPTLRQNINIFRDRNKTIPVDSYDSTYDSEVPRVTLEEMLDDLNIEDIEMAE